MSLIIAPLHVQIRYHFGHRCTGVDFNTNGALFVSEANSDAERMASSAVVIKKSPPADLLIGEPKQLFMLQCWE